MSVTVRVRRPLWRDLLRLKGVLEVPLSLSQLFDLWPRCPQCGTPLLCSTADRWVLACAWCKKHYALRELSA